MAVKEMSEVINGENSIPRAVVTGRQPQEYRIYRANKDLKGTATKWNMRVKQEKGYADVMMFLEATVQTGIDANGNGAFAWKDNEKTVKMKLEAIDIGAVLATLTGVNKETKLFHKNPKVPTSNTVLNITPASNGAFFLNLSAQRNGKTTKVSQTLGVSDVEILKVLLKDAISMIYYWR